MVHRCRPARHGVIRKDQSEQALRTVTPRQVTDEATFNDLWSSVVAAWFRGDRTDPAICPLCLKLGQATILVATFRAQCFGCRIARANLVADHQPDFGDHARLSVPAEAGRTTVNCRARCAVWCRPFVGTVQDARPFGRGGWPKRRIAKINPCPAAGMQCQDLP